MPVTQDQALATIADLESLSIAGDALRDLDASVKTAALLSASAEVLEALRAQFILPLTAWGIGVRQVVCDIAAWKALASRGLNPAGGESGDGAIRGAYEDAIARILRWSTNKSLVPDVVDSSSGAVEGKPTAGPIVTSSASRGYNTRGLDPFQFPGINASNRPPFTGS